MAEVPAIDNPYVGPNAAVLRATFETHQVSQFENEIGARDFYELLPRIRGIGRIAILGSGPAYPAEVRRLYPDAEIACFDFPEMLPELTDADPLLRTVPWGPLRYIPRAERQTFREQHGKFDLIIMKMFAHYVNPHHLSAMVHCLLAKGGSVALSIPHPEETAKYLHTDREPRYQYYSRTIGSTGVVATMLLQSEDGWAYKLGERLPRNYRKVITTSKDAAGNNVRLNILYRPPNLCERAGDIRRRILRAMMELANPA